MPANQLKKIEKWCILFLFVGAVVGLWLTLNAQMEGKMAGEKYTKMQCHKIFAVELNNLVWEFLGKENRTSQEDEKMIHAAHASCYHWSIIGAPINLQRGEWLISHVYAYLNRAEPAVHHAKKCMELTEEHGFKDFDLAYAYEAMARAFASAENKEESAKYIALAREAGSKIEGKKDKELFFSDFKAGPWYGMM
jgi:hypothetical protein